MTDSNASVVLVFDLLQDVNILWPLAQLAAQETNYSIILLASDRFIARDVAGKWQNELDNLAAQTNAALHVFASPLDVYKLLQSKSGVMIAGSESNLNAHSVSHGLFRAAPPGFVRVTLQHGYECIGFLQNREQSMVFGERIRFAADILCSWMEADKLNHMQPSELAKLMVTGPSALLSDESRRGGRGADTGLVCENLHSVRMNAAGDFKADYMEQFASFSADMARKRRNVALRPHPGGQYVIRNAVKLPPNVSLANEPMYRTQLSQYAYGISAPSSVLIDMVLAGIPTAVWQDCGAVIDAGNYAGLERISSVQEWINFAEAAIADPAPFIEHQNEFLERTGIISDRRVVRQRYLELLRIAGPARDTPSCARRVLFVANAEIPTLQLGFLKPLKPLIDAGTIRERIVTEVEMKRHISRDGDQNAAIKWFEGQIDEFKPDIAVFCRYSGPMAEQTIAKLRVHEVPVIFHVDDDLLNVPIEIGEVKFREHNRPERLAAVTTLLEQGDLVYCSTEPLLKRFNALGFEGNLRAGKLYCSATVLSAAVNRPVRKVGYMGFDHAHDLELALPELVQFLVERPEIQFELFGSIPKPAELDQFGDRVIVIPPVRPYEAFLAHFAKLEWDIGICPLADTAFNIVKANTKWVEYTSIGAAVIATEGMAYDQCCADGCGVLVRGGVGWRDALNALCDDPDRRYRMVCAAQDRILEEYSVEKLRNQVLEMFDYAVAARAGSTRIIES